MKEVIISQLPMLRELSENSSVCGSIPIEKESYENTLSFLDNLPSNHLDLLLNISPNPNGTISMSFVGKSESSEIILEIGNKDYSYFLAQNNEWVEGEKGEIKELRNKLLPLIEKLK